MAGVSIRNKTRSSLGGSRLVFSTVAQSVLPGWEISLVFVGAKRARALNTQLRGKTYVPNVLSYALGKKSGPKGAPLGGEIIICLNEAKKQAPRYDMSARTFVLYLFIHGILHIKGGVHGGKMEKCERDLLARFAKG